MNTKPVRSIRQGGMGFNISGWPLARAVALEGQYGTVSGVALERVMAHALRHGDIGGYYRYALEHFPFPRISAEVINAFFVASGSMSEVASRATPVWTADPSHLLISLTICANFANVWLAKNGHGYPVGINYLEKIALPHVYAITGAMLAGADFITMGAGIPLQIPAVISALCRGGPLEYRVPVDGSSVKSVTMRFNPTEFFGEPLPELIPPDFIPIIASNLLASIFMDPRRVPAGSVYGFVIEEPTAGGHNAPPRKPEYDESGMPRPVYGPKDVVDYKKIADLGLPFWIGGSYASPEKLVAVQRFGASGIQAGSIFALTEESGMRADVKHAIRSSGFMGTLEVRTDMRISPTGFPFKVAVLGETLAESELYESRTRVCDQGVLVALYERPDGSIGYRCPAEPVERYVTKGGDIRDTVQRGCICNGLNAAAGLSDNELPIVTLGDDVSFLQKLMAHKESRYTVADAIRYLLST